ncbi:MAG: transporter substrate-binding domain-containing protein [Gammaproteobacteria bacterium]|nr:transporter substrate-binding domain-containing protein [Gammaproteobacteria bacterium]MDD9850586.1 transporter substrate-binding domain-containing protein [Gammaproteobacteria bacterium]
MNTRKIFHFILVTVSVSAAAIVAAPAYADKLDDVIASGKVRCGIMLDVPPVGMRDNDNNPIGFDVEFCRDLAKALGVEAEIVETPSPDRIPAILSGRVDIGVASATNSLERAKSVAFSIPYQIWDTGVAVAADDKTINTYEDLKGKRVGTVRGTSGEAEFLKDYEAWKGTGISYIAYGSNAEQFLALQQGKVDAIVESKQIFGEYVKGPGKGKIKVCCSTNAPSDWTGLMVKREQEGWLRWINLFVWHQWKNGRTDELYRRWFGYPAPDMSYPGVHGY